MSVCVSFTEVQDQRQLSDLFDLRPIINHHNSAELYVPIACGMSLKCIAASVTTKKGTHFSSGNRSAV
jgi:hypothetical protein